MERRMVGQVVVRSLMAGARLDRVIEDTSRYISVARFIGDVRS